MSNEKKIELNRPQALLHIINANKTYGMWGRGTGKSNGGLGPRIVHLFNKMPRSQVGLIVPTYEMAKDKITGNIIGFWQNTMGLVEGEDYVIGIKPPDEWTKPIIPIMKFNNVISFSNGCTMPLISLAVEGAGNGYNLQAVVGDEAKFFDEKKLKEILRALRGCHKDFGHLPEFQSEWYFTDKLDGDIQWMINKRKLVKPKLIDAVISMQLEINRLKEIPGNDDKVFKHENLLNKIRKDLVFVSEASTYENIEILGDKYFKDQKDNSDEIEYSVAILNEDPTRVKNWFYPELKERHYYSITNDVDTTQPIIIATDYQWRIAPIVQAQYRTLPGSNKLTLNINYSCYALAPKGMADAIDTWVYHNRHHSNKTVYYVFDKTATEKRSTSTQAYVAVMQRLQYHGWNVVPIHCGEPPLHTAKFKTINNKLKGSNGTDVMINALRNEALIKSINLTPAISFNGKTSKDKSGEKNQSKPAEDSTHFSDVFDMLLYADDLNAIPKGADTAAFDMVLG